MVSCLEKVENLVGGEFGLEIFGGVFGIEYLVSDTETGLEAFGADFNISGWGGDFLEIPDEGKNIGIDEIGLGGIDDEVGTLGGGVEEVL